MEILRTFRREGELWGETSDGGLVKWDGHEGRWDLDASEESTTAEPVTAQASHPDPNVFAVPHFGGEPGGNGKPLTSGAAATSITDLPPYAEVDIHDPEHPINKWWNRKFPPLSWKRWAFFVAVLPVVGVLVEIYRNVMYGHELSIGRYLFAVFGGWGVLTVVFVFGRRKLQGLKPRTLSNHLLDLGISIVILFLGFLVVDAVITTDLNTFSFLMSLGLAAFVAVVIHFRLYGLAIAAVIAAGGAVVAFFLHLFSLFWGSEVSFFGTWLFISGLGVVCAIPFTIQLHRQTKALEGIPTYAISVLVSGGLMSMVLFMALFNPVSESVDEIQGGAAMRPREAQVQPPPTSNIRGAFSREAAARQLYDSWDKNSRPSAEAVASEHVVGELFLIPREGQPFKGCGNYQVVYNVCVIETSKDLLLLATEKTAGSGGRESFYVQFMMHVPLGTEVAYFSNASKPAS